MSTALDVPTRASLLVAAGDRSNNEARAAFAECYSPLIHDWCRRRGLQEADRDDVTQTILSRLLETLPSFKYDPTKRFRGLVHQAVYFAVVQLHRERQRHPAGHGSGDTGVLSQLQEIPAPNDQAVEDLTQELAGKVEQDFDLQRACERVRRRVKQHTWRAFWLMTVEGKPVGEVAQELGMTKGAVPVAKYHVIKMIRAELTGVAGK
jgi:RNA polymerase sigma-70 factor (ECF subfamily)